MATTYKLVCQFQGANGTINHSYYTEKTAAQMTAAIVNAYMNACVTYGTLFKDVPISKKGAYIVATDKTEITLS